MRPSPRALKLGTMAIIAAAAAIVLWASTQTWYTLHLTERSGHPGALPVPGSTAAPALTALALAGLALTAALAIGGRAARVVLGILGLILAGCLLLSTVSAMADPLGSGGSVVTTRTGVAGSATIARLVGSVTAGPWPVVALAGSILLALGALAALVTGGRWVGASRRYESAPADDDTPAARGPERRTEHEVARDRAIADWDELSRGDDPTD